MMNLNNLMYGENYPISNVLFKGDKVELVVESQIEKCKCPKCDSECGYTHDRHTRLIQDTPIHNKETWINLTVKEFKCEDPECKIKTFTEKLPFAGTNQVMTYYLQYFIVTLAIYMSSSATSLILSLIGVKASADTVDNLLKKIEIKDNPEVEAIGIDDVALRKRIDYATAIYDLNTHQLIALLKGREKEDIIPWLKAHPKIKVVARDRASNYAEAIKEVFPNAVQIADRFHIFHNLTKYLKDMLYQELPDKIVIKNGEILDKKATKVIKELANIDEGILNSLNYDNNLPVDENGNPIKFFNYLYDMNDKLHEQQAKKRQKKYEDIILIRKDNNLTIEELSTKYDYSIYLIKKYLKMTDEEVEETKLKKNYDRKKKTKFSNYVNIIFKMLKDNQPYEYIIAYILKCGYKDSILVLKGAICNIAKNNNINGITFRKYNEYVYAKDETIITRYELLKYILTLDENKTKSKIIEENINIIQNKFPIVKEIKEMFSEFHNTIFSNNTDMLDEFINKYQERLPSFCKGLEKDIAAVKNAISNSINSGFVEGNNNKFKLIKRIVYGKQKLCNLFKRSWLNFTSTLDDLEMLKLTIDPFVKMQKQDI